MFSPFKVLGLSEQIQNASSKTQRATYGLTSPNNFSTLLLKPQGLCTCSSLSSPWLTPDHPTHQFLREAFLVHNTLSPGPVPLCAAHVTSVIQYFFFGLPAGLCSERGEGPFLAGSPLYFQALIKCLFTSRSFTCDLNH